MLLTGASRGLGRAVAEALAARGARLALTATRERHLESVVAGIRAAGGEAHPLAMDLRDRTSVRASAAQALAALGRLDLLVNNAGLLGRRAPLSEVDDATWDDVMAANLTGPVTLIQAVLPGMADGGAIVNVTSGASGRATWGPYAVSKLAIEGVTRMLREELSPRGIRCVAVNPGGLRTGMRAAAYPDEDPATVPRPESVVPVFVAIAAGADPGPRVDGPAWSPR